MKILQLLIIFSILILTKQFEVREDERTNLRPDDWGRLRGLTELWSLERVANCSETRLQQNPTNLQGESGNSAFFISNEKDLDAFLVRFDQQKMEDWLLPSFRREVLVLTGSTNSSDEKMRQESSLDPQQRVPVSMKVLSNQSCRSESDSSTEGETGSQKPHTGSGFAGSVSQRPDGPILELDQQQILMLEDDEVVRRAAASLYQKHPTVSSLYAVDPQQRVQQVKGQAGLLSEPSSSSSSSRLVLVGHGARDHSGEMRISGYSSKDVARIIQSSSRISQKIQTTTVVACDVGSDRRFREALLKKLHEAGMETELHLWNTVVQVAETGEVLSQDGAEWRSEDDSKKVVLTVGRNGEIRTRKDRRHRGHTVHTKDGRFLGKKTEKIPAKKYEWPDKPIRFIDPGVYKHIDQNNVQILNKMFWELESLTWALFYSDLIPEPERVYVDVKNKEIPYIIRNTSPDKDGKSQWINDPQEIVKRLYDCYDITSGRDIRNIIRHYAKDGEAKTTYLMINSWIFEVNHTDLYVYPAGKLLKETDNIGDCKKLIDLRDKGIESYHNIKSNIPAEGKKQYGFYARSIFIVQPFKIKDSKTEMFLTWYFTASVISESARNFRTFPLTLMALDMDEQYIEGGLEFLFNQHSMADGGTWVDTERRGFGGAAAGDLTKLKKVLEREYIMFNKWYNRPHKEYSPEEIGDLTVKYGIFLNDDQFRKDYINFKDNTKPYLDQ